MTLPNLQLQTQYSGHKLTGYILTITALARHFSTATLRRTFFFDNEMLIIMVMISQSVQIGLTVSNCIGIWPWGAPLNNGGKNMWVSASV